MQRITTLDAHEFEHAAALEVTWRDEELIGRSTVDRIELFIGGKTDEDVTIELTATEAEMIGEALMRAARLDRQAEAEVMFSLEELLGKDTGEESEA